VTNFQRTSEDPHDHLGVFGSFEEVTPRYRLSNPKYVTDFEGVDVWADFMSMLREKGDHSDHVLRYTYHATEKLWKEHMDERGRHHALPTPDDVDSFFRAEMEKVTMETLYTRRYVPVSRFFGWLANHSGYPHAYNPVLMAAAGDGATRAVWDHRNERNQKMRTSQ